MAAGLQNLNQEQVQNSKTAFLQFDNPPSLEKIAKVASAIFQTIALFIATLLPFTSFRFSEFRNSMKSIWTFDRASPQATLAAQQPEKTPEEKLKDLVNNNTGLVLDEKLQEPIEQNVETACSSFNTAFDLSRILILRNNGIDEPLMRSHLKENPDALKNILLTLHLNPTQMIQALELLTYATTTRGTLFAFNSCGLPVDSKKFSNPRVSYELDTATGIITRREFREILSNPDNESEGYEGYLMVRTNYDVKNGSAHHEAFFSKNPIDRNAQILQ